VSFGKPTLLRSSMQKRRLLSLKLDPIGGKKRKRGRKEKKKVLFLAQCNPKKRMGAAVNVREGGGRGCVRGSVCGKEGRRWETLKGVVRDCRGKCRAGGGRNVNVYPRDENGNPSRGNTVPTEKKKGALLGEERLLIQKKREESRGWGTRPQANYDGKFSSWGKKPAPILSLF